MTDIIFWSGFCFGIAIVTGVYAIFILTLAIKDALKPSKKKRPKSKFKTTCKGCSAYDEEFGCVRMTNTRCPELYNCDV